MCRTGTAGFEMSTFAWRMRASLLWNGRMPVTRHLPVSWYETQNIHHVTVTDFRELLREKGVAVERSWFFDRDREIGAGEAHCAAGHHLALIIVMWLLDTPAGTAR